MATKLKMMGKPRPAGGFAFDADDEAEALGEEFVATATSGEFIGEDARNEVAEEELIDVCSIYDEDEAEAEAS